MITLRLVRQNMPEVQYCPPIMKRTLAALLLSTSLICASVAQETATFTSAELGLAFDHPSNWIVVKKKNSTLITIPVEGHPEAARLEIFGVAWKDEIPKWELIEQTNNKQLKREIVKQWQEEILGVPLLLTKVAYEADGSRRTSISGLMFSAATSKLKFLLTAQEDAFEGAEYAFRQAMQTLRTTEGKMPVREDPTTPAKPEEYGKVRPAKPPKVTKIGIEKSAEAAPKKGELSLALTVASKPAVLRYGAGWTAETQTDGSILFRHPALAEAVKVATFSTLDSDRPEVALQKAAGTALSEFAKVDRREERVNSHATTIWRSGSTAAGRLANCHATGAMGDMYWLLSSRQSADYTPDQAKALAALIEVMSLEPAA